MRIKYLVCHPLDDAALAELAQRVLPGRLRRPDVEVDFASVKNSIVYGDSDYEWLLMDAYVAEAGLHSEEEGYDAVVVDTTSDSGVQVLRSRLSIPVVGPGALQQHVAAVLGRRFSVLQQWAPWAKVTEKTLVANGMQGLCASVRCIGVNPHDPPAGVDVAELLAVAGRAAIEEDGADVLLLGSATMEHHARPLRSRLGVPVLEPSPLAIGFAELLVRLGLSHSKVAHTSPAALQDHKYHALPAVER